jgi:hypothetical protein
MLGDFGDRFGKRRLVICDETSYIDVEALSADHGLTENVITPEFNRGRATVTDAGPVCEI